MLQIKKLILPLIMIIILAAVNGALYYTSLLNGEIIQSRDVYGKYYSSELRSIKNRQRLLNSISGDLDSDISKLNAEAEELTEYKQAADYILNDNYTAIRKLNELPAEDRRAAAKELYQKAKERFSVSENKLIDRISKEIDDYKAVTSYLEYVFEYNTYVTNISEHSDFLADISIYNDNNAVVSNIIKTKKDFYGLSNIPLTPVTEDGFMAFLNYRASDLLTISVALIAAIFPLLRGKSSVMSSVFLTVFGTVVMYLSNYFLTDIFIGLPSPNTLVQSMESFKSCPYIINVGVMTVGVILLKVIGAVIIALSLTLIISLKGKKRILLLAVFITLAALEFFLGTADNIPHLLKEINVLSCFSFERFFIRYLNLDFLGLSVSRLPLFLIFTVLAAGILLFFAKRVVTTQNLLTIKETEQHYYDEINRRYQESRKIRHDINNHLLAVSSLIESGNIDRAKKYINEVSEKIDLAAMPVKTGSEVLDALLFKKTEQALEKRISLCFEVSCPLLGYGISDYDLCTVFGNIIDNALEAVNENDVITVTIGSQLDMLYIACENPLRKPLRKRGDRILTTKGNPLSHGYGIARIKEIARHYNGTAEIRDEDGKFLIEILINPKNRI